MRTHFPQRNECQHAIDSKGERARARQTFAPSLPEHSVWICLAFDLSHRTVLLSAVLHTRGCKENYLSISSHNKSVWAQRAAASTHFIERRQSCRPEPWLQPSCPLLFHPAATFGGNNHNHSRSHSSNLYKSVAVCFMLHRKRHTSLTEIHA